MLAAAEQYARVLPLIYYENCQCGLRARKTLMCEGGVIASDAIHHPQEPLAPDTLCGLLDLAKDLDAMALHWGQ